MLPHRVVHVVQPHRVGGLRAHTGEKNGMPFQISTSASLAPCQPIISLNAARGNTR